MKITIYELLGLIKEGKAPKKIKYDNYIWTLREQFNDYWNDESYLIVNGFDEWENSRDFLNNEVEIIEEEQDIEEIKIDSEDRIQARSTGNYVYKVNQPMKNIIYKINELIKEVNKLKKEIK